jgi:hypothetical protein
MCLYSKAFVSNLTQLKRRKFMHTQSPFESSSRRLLKSAVSKFIMATLAVAAICLLSFNSAQAQEPSNMPNNCGPAPKVATTDLEIPHTQINPRFGGGYVDDGGFFYNMIGNLVGSAYNYIAPIAAITNPQPPTEDGSATAQLGAPTGPCKVASVSTRIQ